MTATTTRKRRCSFMFAGGEQCQEPASHVAQGSDHRRTEPGPTPGSVSHEMAAPVTADPARSGPTEQTQPVVTAAKKPVRPRHRQLRQGRPKVKRPVGPPTMLTEAIQTTIARLVREGNYLEVAAAYVGVHRTTLFEWLKHGRRYLEAQVGGNPPEPKHAMYGRLVDAVDRAMAGCEIRGNRRIDKAASEDWRAEAFRMERRYPHRWALQSKIDQVAEQKSQEHLREMLERLQARLPPDQYRAACEALAISVDALETKKGGT